MNAVSSRVDDWELLAQQDPFFAVVTDDRYHRDRLTPEAESAFWASGDMYVRDLAVLLRRHLAVSLAPDRALDFGCGVGRLLVPIAGLSRVAVGVDSSPSMLSHAEVACRKAGLSNVQLASAFPSRDSYDFVNSALVFQHIPVRNGLRILDLILRSVRPQGTVAIQLLSARPAARLHRRLGRWLRSRSRLFNGLTNIAQGRAGGAPYMQMNPYPLGRVLALLQRYGFPESVVIATDERGFQSSLVLSRKGP